MKQLYTLLACLLLCASTAYANKDQKAKVVKRAETTLDRPVVKTATNITSNAFTANWEPVEGAEAYCVFVYTKDIAPADGEYAIIDEGFDGVDFGSVIEPGGGDEYSVDLSAYGYAYSYGWEAYAFPNFIPGMVAGLIYSPYIYLVNDGGRYKLHITTYANRDDQIRVESHGEGDKQTVIYTVSTDNPALATTRSTTTLEFDNGSRDLFFSAINVTAEVGQADYFDRFQVTQNLKAGDAVYNNIAADEAVMAEDDWGFDVTSKRFTLNRDYLNGHTQVYYDVYAALHDFSTPNGSLPYTLVVSPYSQRVLVDLQNGTSELVDDDYSAINNLAADSPADNRYYDLTGRPVANPAAGIYIHNGKKIIIK